MRGTRKILLTGAGGFIGRALLEALSPAGLQVRALTRRPESLGPEIESVQAEINARTDWRPLLAGTEMVVHLAARAHRRESGAEAVYQEDRLAALALAEAMAEMGLKRLIHLSSVGVHGRQGFDRRRPGDERASFKPAGLYAASKAETEKDLSALAAEKGLELVIIRPVLTYGPGVKGNLRSLLSWAVRGRPLPLSRVDNRRSLLNVRNLADLIRVCLTHPRAAGQSFIAADGRDLSTPEIYGLICGALGVKARLWPWPVGPLRLICGRRAGQLLDDLCFDASKARELLGWVPPFSVEEGFREMGAYFLEHEAGR